jgi:general stress protein 26
VEAPVYWVSSTRSDGRPHAMPTWGTWLDDSFWFEGGAETQRMKNLARNPAAVVHVERGDDVVIVEGEAERVFELAPELAARLKDGFAKYIETHGYEADPKIWENGGIWRVRPRKVLAWSAFPTDATRWWFDR